MKTKTLMMAVLLIMAPSSSFAQLGNLINRVKRVKETVEDVTAKVNGDVDFEYEGKVQGFYRSRIRQLIFNLTHNEGDRKGKKIIYTFEDNGDIKFDDGRKVGEIKSDGTVNCRSEEGYLKVQSDGSVLMDGEEVGRIDNTGRAFMFNNYVGYAPGIDKSYAAYLFFGIYQSKKTIASNKEKMLAAAKKREEEAAAARRNIMVTTSSSGNSTSRSSGASSGQSKVREYSIQKGSGRGYVDANGVVYNWSHTILGYLPKGSSGDILDKNKNKIGSIWSGDIKDRSGNLLCHVTSGGDISVKGSNATVAETHGGGRIDMLQGRKTLGYCDCGNHVWEAALIFCDFFRF